MTTSWLDRARAFLGVGPAPAERGGARNAIALALQGGGAFGAFAWGALDRLIAEPDLEIEAISGASAGAVNATLLAAGLMEGGPEAARKKLAEFWTRMIRLAALTPGLGLSGLGLGMLLRSLTPQQLNPFDLNPLRQTLGELVDFDALRESSPVRLMIAATRVSDGALRLFETHELTLDAVLASACLPQIHRPIVIEGETYWDGGYAANPPLIPLVQATKAERLLVVQIIPNATDRIPATPSEIERRLQQIQFNATLNRELEALRQGKIIGASPRLAKLRIDVLAAHDGIEGLAEESAANLDRSFVERLQASGHGAAEAWLASAH